MFSNERSQDKSHFASSLPPAHVLLGFHLDASCAPTETHCIVCGVLRSRQQLHSGPAQRGVAFQ